MLLMVIILSIQSSRIFDLENKIKTLDEDIDMLYKDHKCLHEGCSVG